MAGKVTLKEGKKMKKILKWAMWLVLVALLAGSVSAQNSLKGHRGGLQSGISALDKEQMPVKWTAKGKMISETEATVTLTATMGEGWHLYGMNIPADGPEPTKITFSYPKGVKTEGALTADKAPERKTDEMFGSQTEYWSGKVTFTRRLKIDKSLKDVTVKCTVRYMSCNDVTCRPPQTTELEVKIK